MVHERDDDRVDRVRGQRPDHLDGAIGQRRVRQAKLGDFHEWNGLTVLLPYRQAILGWGDERSTAMSAKFSSAIAMMGIDIGKNSFHLIGLPARTAS